MKLEFLDNISDGGKFTGTITDKLVRLFDFDEQQAIIFLQAIQQTILTENVVLDLNTIEIIEPINCNLIFRINDTDIGITTIDNKTFFCDLSITAYMKIIELVGTLCNKSISGYQWLYDLNNEIELLFSKDGQW